MKPPRVAVIGAGTCGGRIELFAERVGQLLAEAGCILYTGGLGGVMEAASRGASRAGGTVVGILPGPDPDTANPWVDIVVATGMGDARNAILCNSADAFIAIAGSYGTLSEVAFALRRNKPIVALESWYVDPAIQHAGTPDQAVALLLHRRRVPGR